MINKKSLRIDIEALRGLSVILVILYHFKLSNLDYQIIKGGFIGVDIFFVISGFIITKIIIENKIENFSLLYFYERRIKRIIPLLAIVLIVSTSSLFFIFDFFLLNKNIDASLAISSSVSNFYFWASAVLYQFAEENNLINLHFWSLSIEMQFYIFFPLLFIIFRNKEKIIHLIIFFLFCLSYLFVVKIYKIHNFFNFYNSFSRIFEFLSGAMIFIYSGLIKQKIKKKFYSYLYVFGLIILFLYLQFLQNEGYHPSPYSLVFILGIGLMVIFNNEESFKKLKLVFSYLGKISYSLYLWHFPILVVGSYIFAELTDYNKLILILICFIVSIITYFLIEKKFRQIKLLYSLILFFILIIFLVFAKHISKSKKENYSNYNLDNYFLAYESSFYLRNNNKYSPRKEKNIFSFKNDSLNFSPQFNLKNNKTKVLIIGDSHSKDLFNFFKTNEKKFENYEFARYGINLIDLKNYRKKNLISSHNFKHANYILFSQRYKKKDLVNLQKLIELSNQNQKKLVIFLKRPEFASNNNKNQTILDLFYLINEKILSKKLMDSFFYDQLKPKNFIPINEEILEEYKDQAVFYDLYPIFCDNNKSSCHSIDQNGKKIFYDYGHLTLDGSRYIGNILFDSKFHTNYLK
ncbi:acyltransferase family protein [Candidatus Pelagibacter sp.]|jgi:peptidoglycan/LPS O-acetylase OafA/YrhL|nr:acyltransferase family protein [Candidatus Pelagibacter sp.]